MTSIEGQGARHEVEYAEKYLRDKIKNVAKIMRDYADEIERDALRAVDSDPGNAAGWTIQAWTNSVNNLRMDLLPRAATDLLQARARLTAWENSNPDADPDADPGEITGGDQ